MSCWASREPAGGVSMFLDTKWGLVPAWGLRSRGPGPGWGWAQGSAPLRPEPGTRPGTRLLAFSLQNPFTWINGNQGSYKMVLCSQELTSGWLTKHTPICSLRYCNTSASRRGFMWRSSWETKPTGVTNPLRSRLVAVGGGGGPSRTSVR